MIVVMGYWCAMKILCYKFEFSDILKGGDMVFNATFNNIAVISWQSVLLVEETRVPGESHQPATSHWQILSHNVVSNTSHHESMSKIRTHSISGDRHDSTDSCKSNYHMIETTMAPDIRKVYTCISVCQATPDFPYFSWFFLILSCSWFFPEFVR